MGVRPPKKLLTMVLYLALESKLRVSEFFWVYLGMENKEIIIPKMKGLDAPFLS